MRVITRADWAVWALLFIGLSLIVMMNLPDENTTGFLLLASLFAAVGLAAAWRAILGRR